MYKIAVCDISICRIFVATNGPKQTKTDQNRALQSKCENLKVSENFLIR